MSNNAKSQPEERARAQRCLEMKLEGHTWMVVADALGYADESGARKATERLLDRTGSELASEYRSLELGRLDALHAAYWTAAVSGDAKAAEIVLKVTAQRVKLLGLAVPEKVIVAQANVGSDEDFSTTMVRMMLEIGVQPPPELAATLPAGEIPARLLDEPADTQIDDWVNP